MFANVNAKYVISITIRHKLPQFYTLLSKQTHLCGISNLSHRHIFIIHPLPITYKYIILRKNVAQNKSIRHIVVLVIIVHLHYIGNSFFMIISVVRHMANLNRNPANTLAGLEKLLNFAIKTNHPVAGSMFLPVSASDSWHLLLRRSSLPARVLLT